MGQEKKLLVVYPRKKSNGMYTLFSKITSLVLIGVFLIGPSHVQALTVEISANVSGCGDEVIGVGEECDSSSLGGASCVSLGFSGGSLSCSSSCAFNTTSCTSGGGGGGGSSGSGSTPSTNVVFSGRAYPLSTITILKDGQLILTTIAGPDSKFNATISGLSTGNYIFSVYSEDENGINSSPFTFPIYITSGVTTSIGGIFIAPTIGLDKSQVKWGDTISVFGQTTPDADVTININSEPEYFVVEEADEDGAYLLNFNSALLAYGSHSAKSKSQIGNEISPFGASVGFLVGDTTILNDGQVSCPGKGDLNNDCRVNLIDFSIAAYWYKRPLSSAVIVKENTMLSGDSKIDLVDFSILAYHWTG